jgi:hypothetical protein
MKQIEIAQEFNSIKELINQYVPTKLNRKISFAETEIIQKIKWYYYLLGAIIGVPIIIFEELFEDETGLSVDYLYNSFLVIILLVLLFHKKRFKWKLYGDILVFDGDNLYIFKEVINPSGKIISKECSIFSINYIKKVISKRSLLYKILNQSFFYNPEIIFNDEQKITFKPIHKKLAALVDKINEKDLANEIVDLKMFIDYIIINKKS